VSSDDLVVVADEPKSDEAARTTTRAELTACARRRGDATYGTATARWIVWAFESTVM